jgi:hypothetical protein
VPTGTASRPAVCDRETTGMLAYRAGMLHDLRRPEACPGGRRWRTADEAAGHARRVRAPDTGDDVVQVTHVLSVDLGAGALQRCRQVVGNVGHCGRADRMRLAGNVLDIDHCPAGGELCGRITSAFGVRRSQHGRRPVRERRRAQPRQSAGAPAETGLRSSPGFALTDRFTADRITGRSCDRRHGHPLPLRRTRRGRGTLPSRSGCVSTSAAG